VLAADHQPTGKSAPRNRAQAHDGGDGRVVLRQVPRRLLLDIGAMESRGTTAQRNGRFSLPVNEPCQLTICHLPDRTESEALWLARPLCLRARKG
jgi:hypothetical protein